MSVLGRIKDGGNKPSFQESPPDRVKDSGKYLVVLITRSPALKEGIQKALVLPEFTVFYSASADAAQIARELNLYRRRPDLVVLDHCMARNRDAFLTLVTSFYNGGYRVLTLVEDLRAENVVRDAYLAGAHHVFPRNESLANIVAEIREDVVEAIRS